MLVIWEGAYGRYYTFLPRKKIQYAVKSQNLFQRYSRVANISAYSASPSMPSAVVVDTLVADKWLVWIENYTPYRVKSTLDLRGFLSTCQAPEPQCIQ